MPYKPLGQTQACTKVKTLFSYIYLRASKFQTDSFNPMEAKIFSETRAAARLNKNQFIKEIAVGTLDMKVKSIQAKDPNASIYTALNDPKYKKILQERFKPWLTFLLGETPTDKEELDFFTYFDEKANTYKEMEKMSSTINFSTEQGQNTYHPDFIQFRNFIKHLNGRPDLDVSLDQFLTNKDEISQQPQIILE